jgi:hypothetical protein
MDPEIDRQISEHVARMHRYCTDDGGNFVVVQSQQIFLRSSIHFICSIKEKTCKLQEQGLLIKRDMLKRMMVMLMQLFLLNMIECSMVRIEEEARKRSKTD